MNISAVFEINCPPPPPPPPGSLRYQPNCHVACPGCSYVGHDVVLNREVKESTCRHVAVSAASHRDLAALQSSPVSCHDAACTRSDAGLLDHTH